MPPQDLITGRVQPGFGVALVDAEEDVHPVERPHRLDGDLIRVAGTHANDEQFAHLNDPSCCRSSAARDHCPQS